MTWAVISLFMAISAPRKSSGTTNILHTNIRNGQSAQTQYGRNKSWMGSTDTDGLFSWNGAKNMTQNISIACRSESEVIKEAFHTCIKNVNIYIGQLIPPDPLMALKEKKINFNALIYLSNAILTQYTFSLKGWTYRLSMSFCNM